MATPAPQADLNRAATFAHSIADISSANVDLRAIAAHPNFAAQRVRLNNATTGTLSAILTPQDGGTDLTVPVNAGQQYEVEVPIKTIKNTSGAMSALCYWYAGASLDINK